MELNMVIPLRPQGGAVQGTVPIPELLLSIRARAAKLY